MIQVQALTKVYGQQTVVDQLSFELAKGEVLGFLGPNGAGKSTTMRMLTCFIPPTSGTATVCGFDILKDPLNVRRHIGYLPESAPSYGEMLIGEFLRFAAEMRGFCGKEALLQVDRALELADLTDVRFQMIETLSKGYRQRTCLAQALIGNPSILVLDEPTDGLDPNQKHEIRGLIKRMSEQRAILVSTHILEEVEAVCSRAIIIAKGRIVANGTPRELLSQSLLYNAVNLTLSTSTDLSPLLPLLHKIQGVSSVQVLIHSDPSVVHLQILPENGAPLLDAVQQFIQNQSLKFLQIHVQQGRLDDVFRKVTHSK